MRSPYGEHFVCCTSNAPTDRDELNLYVLLTRVRRFDRNTRAGFPTDTTVELTDEQHDAYERESRDIGEDGR